MTEKYDEMANFFGMTLIAYLYFARDNTCRCVICLSKFMFKWFGYKTTRIGSERAEMVWSRDIYPLSKHLAIYATLPNLQH